MSGYIPPDLEHPEWCRCPGCEFERDRKLREQIAKELELIKRDFAPGETLTYEGRTFEIVVAEDRHNHVGHLVAHVRGRAPNEDLSVCGRYIPADDGPGGRAIPCGVCGRFIAWAMSPPPRNPPGGYGGGMG